MTPAVVTPWAGPHTLAPVVLAPGPSPDVLLVVRNTALRGRAIAAATAPSSCTGVLAHATAALLGLAALPGASDETFTAVKIVGAG